MKGNESNQQRQCSRRDAPLERGSCHSVARRPRVAGGLHGTVDVPHSSSRFLAAMAGVRRAGDSHQRRLHGPGQLGHRPCRRRAVQVRPALGRRPRQSDGDLPAGDLGPAWAWSPARTWPSAAATGIRAGPAGPTGSPWKSPSAPPTWPSRWAAPSPSTCCSTSRCLWAIIITAFDVLLLLALAGTGHADDRGGGRGLRADHRRLLRHRDLRASRRPSPAFVEMGRALVRPNFRQAGMLVVAIGMIGATVMPHNLYLHSALVQTRKLQKDEHSIRTRHPLQHDRLHRRADHRVLRQRGDPGAGGDGLLRQRQRDRGRRPGGHLQPRQRLDSRRVSDAGAAAGHGCRPARCSPWRCWPADKAARSPARWPGRW